MKTVSATEFKSHCLALLDEVHRTRRRLLVTRHGKPIAEIAPHSPPNAARSNPLKGSILHQDDLVSPIDIRWDSGP
jgi:prevent-host-death family protein